MKPWALGLEQLLMVNYENCKQWKFIHKFICLFKLDVILLLSKICKLITVTSCSLHVNEVVTDLNHRQKQIHNSFVNFVSNRRQDNILIEISKETWFIFSGSWLLRNDFQFMLQSETKSFLFVTFVTQTFQASHAEFAWKVLLMLS